ncbi:UNVERIFIED_CONTAM: hypothetical protein HDU68_005477 [Siphonaria sp. JEL0065]|nr:hypothetical protein HDU68_005477 [Siphonaria sp. JEL0065]
MSISREITTPFSSVDLLVEGSAIVNVIVRKGSEKSALASYEKTSGKDDLFNATTLETVVNNDKLSIRLASPTFTSIVVFGLGNHLSLDLIVTLPLDLDNLSLFSNKSGKFTLHGINVRGSLDATATHGSINIETVISAENVALRSQDGKINLQYNLIGSKSVSLQSVHGSIVGQSLSGDSISVKSNDGKIDLQDVEKSKIIFFESVHGGIYAKRVGGEAVTIKSNDGKIDLQEVNAKAVVLESVHGGIRSRSIVSDSVSIKANDGKIDVESIASKTVALQSVHGSIVASSITGESISVKSNDGKIQVDTIPDAKVVVLDATHGSVKAGSIAAETITIKSHDGKISADQIRALGRVDLKSLHGSIAVNQLTASILNGQSDDGGINFSTVSANNITLNSIHGSISGSYSNYTNLRANANDGSIKFSLAPNEYQSTSSLESQHGNVNATVTGFTGAFSFASTHGSVKVSGPDGPLKKGEKSVSGFIGEETEKNRSSVFHSKTVTGSVDVRFLPGFIEQ